MQDWKQDYFDRYITFVVERARLVSILSFLGIMAVTSGLALLPEPSSDFRYLLGEQNPYLIALENFEDTYSASNAALIAVAPADGNVFTRETLEAIEELTEAGWLVPHSIRVSSLTNYTHSEAEGDDLAVGPLVEDAESLDDADLARVEAIALNADEISGSLVSPDGRVAGVAISFVLPVEADPVIAEINQYLDELLSEVRSNHPQINYYMTGNVILRGALLEAPLNDLSILGPILVAVMVVMASILLRSFLAVLVVICLVGLMGAATMGFAGWIGTIISPVTVIVPLIVMILGIAHSVHIVKTAQERMHDGLSNKEAVADSLRTNGWPVFLTSVSTGIGFLSLNFSISQSFQILGNLAAFGTLCSFVFSMTALPALLAALPISAPHKNTMGLEFFGHLGDFIVERRRYLLVICSVTAFGLIAGLSQINLNDSWTGYFDESYEFRRDTDFITGNLGGLDSVEYSLSSGQEGGISEIGYLHSVDDFAEWARSQPEVNHVQAFTDIIKRLNKNMNGDDPAYYRIPDDPALAAQYLFLYELSLPLGSDLNDRFDLSKSSTRMTIMLNETSSQEIREFTARVQSWLDANHPDLVSPATGISVLFANIARLNNRGMIIGMAVTMGVISLLMFPVFRTFRLGLVCLVPNLVPLCVSFGLWGYLIGDLGFGASAVAATAIGIVVDDTIHFMVRYLKGRQQGLTPQDAIRLVIRYTAPALLITTTILTAGFLVFTASGFEPSWAIGLLLSFILVFAIGADFFLLPPLLMLIDRGSSYPVQAPKTA